VALSQLSNAPDGHPQVLARPLVHRQLVLVADARIDNGDEIEPWLLRRGYLAGGPRQRRSDSELIVAAHRCWGDDAPARLVGDFAYVLWDRWQRRLLMVRDPMGMRPLYHRIEPGRLLAASEIKQILAAPGVPAVIDERGIACTMAGPYLPADATVYQGIGQLAPGHTLSVEDGARRGRRYWAPDASRALDLTADQCIDAYRGRLIRAVADRVRDHDSVALFLSGGLDSGSIASVAGWLHRNGRLSGPPLRTYSWAFASLPDSDERAVSDLIIQHYGMSGSTVTGDDLWPMSGFPEHGPDRDDPYIWVYQALIEQTLARCAGDGANVVLSGDRGDELLGDWVYDETGLLRTGRFAWAIEDLQAARRVERSSALRTLRAHVLRPLLSHHAPALAETWTRRKRSGPRWAPWVSEDLARRVDLADIIADATRVPAFDGYARSVRHHRLFSRQAARVAVLRNRTRARFGMEFADPYADRRLVEFILALPQWRVQRRGHPKQLAREAIRGIMPERARNRAAKTIPVSLFDRGFREEAVPTVNALLTGSRSAANGWLNEPALREYYAAYVRTGDAVHDFWWPLTVEWWLRRWWE
jgi:asparagine synthase (glutamine-hydrolysing)